MYMHPYAIREPHAAANRRDAVSAINIRGGQSAVFLQNNMICFTRSLLEPTWCQRSEPAWPFSCFAMRLIEQWRAAPICPHFLIAADWQRTSVDGRRAGPALFRGANTCWWLALARIMLPYDVPRTEDPPLAGDNDRMEGMLAMAAHDNAPTTDHGETGAGTATASDRRVSSRALWSRDRPRLRWSALPAATCRWPARRGCRRQRAWARASTTTSPSRTRRCTGATSARRSSRWSRSSSGDFVTIETSPTTPTTTPSA